MCCFLGWQFFFSFFGLGLGRNIWFDELRFYGFKSIWSLQHHLVPQRMIKYKDLQCSPGHDGLRQLIVDTGNKIKKRTAGIWQQLISNKAVGMKKINHPFLFFQLIASNKRQQQWCKNIFGPHSQQAQQQWWYWIIDCNGKKNLWGTADPCSR